MSDSETRLIVKAEPWTGKGRDRDVLKGQGRSCDEVAEVTIAESKGECIYWE